MKRRTRNPRARGAAVGEAPRPPPEACGHSLYRYGLATGAFSVGHEAVASASQLIRQLEASTKLRLQQRGGRVLPGTAALVAPIGSRCAAGCGFSARTGPSAAAEQLAAAGQCINTLTL